LLSLEVPSHDASAANGAMPRGRLSRDSLVANANLNHGSHLLAPVINIMSMDLSSVRGSALTRRDKTAKTWEVGGAKSDGLASQSEER
jgi:hypothetical protein